MSDNLGEYFNSDDLTNTYRCKVVADYFDGKKVSNIVPEFNGEPAIPGWLTIKFEVIDEESDQYGFEFPQGGGYTGEMFEYFPWLQGANALKQLSPDQRKKIQQAYDKRLRRLRSLSIPESRLSDVKPEDLTGLIVDIEVKTSTSSKDNVTKYHNVNKVVVIDPDEEADIDLEL